MVALFNPMLVTTPLKEPVPTKSPERRREEGGNSVSRVIDEWSTTREKEGGSTLHV